MEGIHIERAEIAVVCATVALITIFFFIGFLAGRSYQQQYEEQEKIECIKDSLYNEYVTDKLNKQ